MKNEPIFCSWSGGKDSCLALYKAINAGALPKFLLTMFIDGGGRTRSHGLAGEIIEAQAKSLTIPLLKAQSSWEDYESNFIAAAEKMKNDGAEAGVFGDIDFDSNREWEEKVCAEAGLKAYLPLWKKDRDEIVAEFINTGFKAVIIAVNSEKLDKRYLGKILDNSLLEDLRKENVDVCGEEGEFHTVVVDGPIFSTPLHIEIGERIMKSNYWFQDICLKP